MTRIAFIGYRKWGYEIYKNLLAFQREYPKFKLDLIITSPSSEFKNETKTNKFYVVEGSDNKRIYKLLKENKIDIAICYSWSWILREPILSEVICLCLHPSPVPKYRGGTPIQHQIIQGETKSAVSIFRMSSGIDDGPVYSQTPISFRGDVDDIFRRMVRVGALETKRLIKDFNNNRLKFIPQKNIKKYPAWKRRKPQESEITIKQLESMTFEELNNFVRALTGPYPNAFIQVKNGKLYLLKVNKIFNKKPLLSDKEDLIDGQQVFLKLKDSYAKVSKYRFEKISVMP